MIGRTLLVLIGVVVLGCGLGCSQRNAGFEQIRELLVLAGEDNVSGTLKVRINAGAEAGLRQGVYLASPGSSAEADLTIRLKDVDAPGEQ